MIITPTGIRQGSNAPPNENGVAAAPRAVGADEFIAAAQRQAASRATNSLNSKVQLSIEPQSGEPIVRVVDPESGQIIRQIPTEELLELRRVLDRVAGLLIDRTV